MEKPLREHFEVETDVGDSLRTFDYIDQLEKYILTLEQQIRKSKIESLIRTQVRFLPTENKWTVSNHGDFSFYPQGHYKPLFDTKRETDSVFKEHLMQNFK